MFNKFSRVFFIVLALCMGGTIGTAATFTYTFEGGNFADIADNPFVPGAYDTSMRVTGYVTLSKALPSDLDIDSIGPGVIGDPIGFGLLDFSFSDGRQTIDMTNTLIAATIKFGTDSAGKITDHFINLSYKALPFAGNNSITANSKAAVVKSGAVLWACPPGVGCRADSVNSKSAGSWTEPSDPSVVPLPASLPVLLAALGGFGYMARRRRGA